MKKLFLALMLCPVVCASAKHTESQDSTVRTIKANLTQKEGNIPSSYLKCIGAGRAAEGLRADWQKQLTEVQQEMPFEYIRFHGLLHDDMGVYFNVDGKEVYNFQYIDALYDYLLSIDIKPFVELSFMPKDLSSGDKSVFWWKGNITPPKSYEAWGRLVGALAEHLTDRYGAEEVGTWYFEVWNEPDIPPFFSGEKEDYYKMYEYAAQAIKDVNQDYIVGGPATATTNWLEDFVEHCQESNIPLDFVSTHNYGVYGALDEFGTQQLRLILNPNTVANNVNNVRAMIDETSDKDLELHYTEWNSSYSPRDLTHDTYLNAAYVLNTLRHVDQDVASMSYWTFTDVFEESGVPMEPLHGGFGLMTMSGLKKPTYYSYLYLSQLGDTEIACSDENTWVCKDEEGGIQILTYDVTMPTYGESDFNNTIFAEERPAALKGKVDVELEETPNGLYHLEVYKTGYRNNDIQTIFFDLGKPHNLSPVQLEVMDSHSKNTPIRQEVVEVEDGTFEIDLPLYENDIYFINLKKI